MITIAIITLNGTLNEILIVSMVDDLSTVFFLNILICSLCDDFKFLLAIRLQARSKYKIELYNFHFRNTEIECLACM